MLAFGLAIFYSVRVMVRSSHTDVRSPSLAMTWVWNGYR
ncbi:hypothetical protein BKA01_006190 [Pseudonocardia eucalypti]|nr:hypothetical protein [Pseudonocardia eucalypti]